MFSTVINGILLTYAIIFMISRIAFNITFTFYTKIRSIRDFAFITT